MVRVQWNNNNGNGDGDDFRDPGELRGHLNAAKTAASPGQLLAELLVIVFSLHFSCVQS